MFLIVLDPSKKMAYFCKHWPSDLVLDIEEVVQTRVSYLISTNRILICIYFNIKFLKYFNARQSKPSAKSVWVHKAPATCKPTCPNVDDTDSEDNSDSCDTAAIPTNTGMDKWKTYLNITEDIPEGMGIVGWWGVCYLFHSLCVHHWCCVL